MGILNYVPPYRIYKGVKEHFGIPDPKDLFQGLMGNPEERKRAVEEASGKTRELQGQMTTERMNALGQAMKYFQPANSQFTRMYGQGFDLDNFYRPFGNTGQAPPPPPQEQPPGGPSGAPVGNYKPDQVPGMAGGNQNAGAAAYAQYMRNQGMRDGMRGGSGGMY